MDGPLLSCTCRAEINEISQKTRAPSLDVASIFDLSENLATTFNNSFRCKECCYQPLQYTQLLLESINRLLDFFDAVWLAIREDETTSNELTPNRTHCVPTVTGCQSFATVDRFVLDESEKKILAQEVLRVSAVSMNKIIKDIRHRMQQARSNTERRQPTTDFDGFIDLSNKILERTYAALATYKNFAVR